MATGRCGQHGVTAQHSVMEGSKHEGGIVTTPRRLPTEFHVLGTNRNGECAIPTCVKVGYYDRILEISQKSNLANEWRVWINLNKILRIGLPVPDEVSLLTKGYSSWLSGNTSWHKTIGKVGNDSMSWKSNLDDKVYALMGIEPRTLRLRVRNCTVSLYCTFLLRRSLVFSGDLVQN